MDSDPIRKLHYVSVRVYKISNVYGYVWYRKKYTDNGIGID